MGPSDRRHGRSVVLNKAIAVITILGTLCVFVTLSHAFGQDRAQRIACIHNQHQMCDAIYAYQANNSGINPAKLWAVRGYYSDPPEQFGRCPADLDEAYSYDRETGLVTCPNPAHQEAR